MRVPTCATVLWAAGLFLVGCEQHSEPAASGSKPAAAVPSADLAKVVIEVPGMT
jgi:hypothetical protein